MSTRANIIVAQKGSNRVVQIYHHCDGYLAGVGEELHCMLNIANYATGVYKKRPHTIAAYMPSFMQVLASFGGADYEVESFDPTYEAITRQPESERWCDILTLKKNNHLHQDIEYLYLIWCNEIGYDFYMLNLHHCLTNVKDKNLTYQQIINAVKIEGVKLPIDFIDKPYTDGMEAALLSKKSKELSVAYDEDENEDSGDDEVHVEMHFVLPETMV